MGGASAATVVSVFRELAPLAGHHRQRQVLVVRLCNWQSLTGGTGLCCVDGERSGGTAFLLSSRTLQLELISRSALPVGARLRAINLSELLSPASGLLQNGCQLGSSSRRSLRSYRSHAGASLVSGKKRGEAPAPRCRRPLVDNRISRLDLSGLKCFRQFAFPTS